MIFQTSRWSASSMPTRACSVPTFAASERLAQSFVQVAGRAGRADRPGEVLIQTSFPDHPLLRAGAIRLPAFAEQALAERRESGWPPYGFLALLRAEAAQRPCLAFLDEAREQATRTGPHGELLGPAPAPMERAPGRYRGQLLVRRTGRALLQTFLAQWQPALEPLRSGRRVRWSLDVDPG